MSNSVAPGTIVSGDSARLDWGLGRLLWAAELDWGASALPAEERKVDTLTAMLGSPNS